MKDIMNMHPSSYFTDIQRDTYEGVNVILHIQLVDSVCFMAEMKDIKRFLIKRH
jgi:hypothetical protein